jgi:3-oxoacyl-[acyl-carrier protein] reductase
LDFEDKIVFVTAAAGAGIGQAVARGFSREGAVVVMSDQHAARTKSVAESIREETGREVVGFPLDVRDEAAIDAALTDVVKTYGRIDVVVNNSGINQLSPLHEMPTEVWRQVMDVTLTGPFLVTRRALTFMREQRSGAIVNMSSINGWVGTAEGEAHYSAAKAGVMGLTRATAIEAAPFGIRVNAVAPGLAWNNFLAKVYPTEYMDSMVARTPLGRAGTPEDIANAVLFLASDKASFITGEVLCVSGGYYVRG